MHSWRNLTAPQAFHKITSGITCLVTLKGYAATQQITVKLVVDTSKITVFVEKKNGLPPNEIIYNASMNVFGVFADGAPVKLNSEVKVFSGYRS